MMKSLEVSAQKADCGEASNSLAFLVYVRIWIPSTKGISSARTDQYNLDVHGSFMDVSFVSCVFITLQS